MDAELNRDKQLKLEEVEQSELMRITGGVMGTFDDFGNLIRTCTGPVSPFNYPPLPWKGTVRLG